VFYSAYHRYRQLRETAPRGHSAMIICATLRRVCVFGLLRLKVCLIGAGDVGQLGFGERADVEIPTKLEMFGLPVGRIACGAYHTLLVSDSPTNPLIFERIN